MCSKAAFPIMGFILFYSFIPPSTFCQEIPLRHKFTAGQYGRAQTRVDMHGDSFLTGKKAATNLNMIMIKDFRVKNVDPQGNADLELAVLRIKTQGKMDDTRFDEDLMGEKLKQVMFGATHSTMQISPLGQVQSAGDMSLDKLGITLPTQMSGTGGFEVPTFPLETVQTGDSWTENGMLLGRNTRVNGNVAAEKVYQLKRITNSNNGRIALIHYKKTSDLSGMGLGSLDQLLGGGASGLAGAVQVPGLVIQLEGEIEFNIDRGIMIRTIQQGWWKLGMKTASVNQGKPVDVQQSMGIKIQTVFQWGQPNRTLTGRSLQPRSQTSDVPPVVKLKEPENPDK